MTSTDSTRPHPHLRVERDGAVLTLTLDSPQRRNAQVPSLWASLARIGESLDAEVRVVIIRAEGPSFSAGLDRAMLTAEGAPGEPSVLALAARSADRLADAIEEFQRGFAIWSQVPAVVIGAVQGHAIGAGFQLALACDLRVVSDDVELAMRETSLGLVPDLAGTSPLVRVVGYARALELCATGRFVRAEEAVRLGLAQLAVPREELDAAVKDLADAVLAAPVEALRELKPLLLRAAASDAATQQRHEREAQARLLGGLVRGNGKQD